MLHSMTGFATLNGENGVFNWTWDLRSVNAKGLDIRQRVPDWIEGLEAAVRVELNKVLSRGSVSLALKIQKKEEQGALALNRTQLSNVLQALHEAETVAAEQGVNLAASRSVDILNVRGVLETASDGGDQKALLAVLLKQLPVLLNKFQEMRQTEGKALHTVLSEQLTQVETLTADATVVAERRQVETAQKLHTNLKRVMENADGVDSERVAQELAIIAVKADVTEELDRLRAHIEAARDFLKKGSPVGRKLDFLMQEFNREANTLCSKAQLIDLTRIGLDLKSVIDQMREQIQNVE